MKDEQQQHEFVVACPKCGFVLFYHRGKPYAGVRRLTFFLCRSYTLCPNCLKSSLFACLRNQDVGEVDFVDTSRLVPGEMYQKIYWGTRAGAKRRRYKRKSS